MRFGIPLLADRVAPRCTFADSILLVTAKGRRIQDETLVPLEGNTWMDLVGVLTDHQVDTLVCGGISRTTRDSIQAREVAVIDNVAGTSEEVLDALRKGHIHPGFGLGFGEEMETHPGAAGDVERKTNPASTPDPLEEHDGGEPRDCLDCRKRVCLKGEPCPYLAIPPAGPHPKESLRVLESAWDVALEEERSLCRLAELVYFALEMGYRRLGVAFCEDLRQPAEILVGVLRRFFEVVPVSCRVKRPDAESERLDVPHGGCDPGVAAALLNARATDLNVLVGFCVGSDCLFNQLSRAPVTTLFVKDKSLANNPIGAVYSHYYLRDI